MFRVLQADLVSLKSIAIPGIVHGAAEVIERSTMVITDHVCHVILKRKSAPWGSFRTPRRERLMADVAILSMLYESTAIVSVNSDLYLYQFIYLQNIPLLKLLQKFAVHTSVALVTEVFFTGASLAIETHQNIAVMAVWKKEKGKNGKKKEKWKRHILVAIANLVPLAIWTTPHLLEIVHGRFYEFQSHRYRLALLLHYRNETVNDNLLFEHYANRTQHQYRARMSLLRTSLGSIIYACTLLEK